MSETTETREPITHDLKTVQPYFDAVVDGSKTFELRQDDRESGFRVGDTLRLREWEPKRRRLTMEQFIEKTQALGIDDFTPDNAWRKMYDEWKADITPGYYTGREISKIVSYVLDPDDFLPDAGGYVILGLKEEKP